MPFGLPRPALTRPAPVFVALHPRSRAMRTPSAHGTVTFQSGYTWLTSGPSFSPLFVPRSWATR